MPDLDEANIQSHSLETILHTRDSFDETDKKRGSTIREDRIPGIMVTRQIDQVNENKSGDRSGTEYFGVVTDTSTAGH